MHRTRLWGQMANLGGQKCVRVFCDMKRGHGRIRWRTHKSTLRGYWSSGYPGFLPGRTSAKQRTSNQSINKSFPCDNYQVNYWAKAQGDSSHEQDENHPTYIMFGDLP